MLRRGLASLAGAAPWALETKTTWSRSCCSPAGLALAARTTPTSTTLLNLQTAQFKDGAKPIAVGARFKLLLAGTALGALVSTEAECAPKKRAKTGTNSKPAAAKKPGPALSAIEEALQPEKIFNVEELIASRLKGGVKEYLVRWEGYDAKHDSWEPMQNLSNLVEMMAAFDKAKADANQKHLDELKRQKDERETARRAAAGTDGADPGEPAEEEEVVGKEEGEDWGKKKVSRCYEVFRKSEKPGYATCIATEGVPGGCQCGEDIKAYTQSLWNHIKSKHPRLWQELKGKLEAGAALDGGVVASVGAMSGQTTIVAPRLTEARKKQCDRACARWLIKSTRPITLPVCCARVRPARTPCPAQNLEPELSLLTQLVCAGA